MKLLEGTRVFSAVAVAIGAVVALAPSSLALSTTRGANPSYWLNSGKHCRFDFSREVESHDGSTSFLCIRRPAPPTSTTSTTTTSTTTTSTTTTSTTTTTTPHQPVLDPAIALTVAGTPTATLTVTIGTSADWANAGVKPTGSVDYEIVNLETFAITSGSAVVTSGIATFDFVPDPSEAATYETFISYGGDANFPVDSDITVFDFNL